MSTISFNSNVAALSAQRQLGQNTTQLDQSFSRLSSGLRINRASDDAAGLAISSLLNVDRRVLDQGIRNLNDGLGLLNIADGAVTELSSIVLRLRELASSASNGTYSNQQRRSLDREAQELSREYARIARSTSVNGRSLFNHDSGPVSLQAGYGEDGRIAAALGVGIGDGTFQARVSYSAGTGTPGPRGLASADLNGDGTPDLVSGSSTTSGVSVLLGNGDGTFASTVSYATGMTVYDVVLGDFNGDGIKDLVGSSTGLSLMSVLLGNGDGTFRSFTLYSASRTTNISAADLNGDGYLDVATAPPSSTIFQTMLGNGNGTFKAPQVHTISYGGFTEIDFGDLNGDGIKDLVVGASTSRIYTLIGNGNGTFQAATSINFGSSNDSIVVRDFNYDGITDIIAGDTSQNVLSVLIGNGDGTFLARRSYSAGGAMNDIDVGDFNGDGNLDVVGTGFSTRVDVMLGNADGSFRANIRNVVGSSGQEVIVADFNGDGVSEIAVSEFNDHRLSILMANAAPGISSIAPFSLALREDALDAQAIFENTQNLLSRSRTTIGSFQSRIDISTSNLRQTVSSITSAASQITDVDIAAETAELVRTRTLQDAATAILAQANQLPALALRLLSGPSLSRGP